MTAFLSFRPIVREQIKSSHHELQLPGIYAAIGHSGLK